MSYEEDFIRPTIQQMNDFFATPEGKITFFDLLMEIYKSKDYKDLIEGLINENLESGQGQIIVNILISKYLNDLSLLQRLSNVETFLGVNDENCLIEDIDFKAKTRHYQILNREEEKAVIPSLEEQFSELQQKISFLEDKITKLEASIPRYPDEDPRINFDNKLEGRAYFFVKILKRERKDPITKTRKIEPKEAKRILINDIRIPEEFRLKENPSNGVQKDRVFKKAYELYPKNIIIKPLEHSNKIIIEWKDTKKCD